MLFKAVPLLSRHLLVSGHQRQNQLGSRNFLPIFTLIQTCIQQTSLLNLVFTRRKNPRRSGISLFPHPSPILPTYKNTKSQTSPIIWDGRGQIGKIGSVSIFPTRPRFLRCSAIFPTFRPKLSWDGREIAKSLIVWDFPDL